MRRLVRAFRLQMRRERQPARSTSENPGSLCGPEIYEFSTIPTGAERLLATRLGRVASLESARAGFGGIAGTPQLVRVSSVPVSGERPWHRLNQALFAHYCCLKAEWGVRPLQTPDPTHRRERVVPAFGKRTTS
jgi:hypothetical protein